MDHNITNSTVKEIVDRSKNVDPDLVYKYIYNRNVDQPAYGILIVLYGILIVLGALGNTLVILSVVRKPAMRTPRNMFIVNLAISDLLLCAVTMPLTLMEILTKYFPLGNHAIICNMIGPLQATSIFVSTITITAIALDRYQVIVYPTKESLQLFGAALILFLIWIIAIILASPLFIYRSLAHHDITLTESDLHINICFEEWPIGRYHYSIFSFIFQYSLPIVIVSVAYIRILYKLRYRFAAGFVAQNETQNNSRRQLRGRRLQRTNMLLVSIAVIFFMSWLPLNLFNLIADIYTADFNSQRIIIAFAICHMMGMSSACSNPILYGWLNENFWKEFQDIMCLSSKSSVRNGSKRSSLRKSANKMQTDKPDLVADFNPGTSVNTEMSLLSKC